MGKILVLGVSLLTSVAWGYSEKDFDFTQFQNLIETTQAENVTELLPQIKEQNPVLFSRYVIGYRSRSLQASSAKAPRVLLFTNLGDFALTFNGNKRHSGYDTLEVLHFNKEEYKFDFFEVSFNQGKAQLSPANPQKCLACHQSRQRLNADPRPNWEPYSNWPGFYGSLDDDTDLFINSLDRDKRYDKKEDKVFYEEAHKEVALYEDFNNNIRPNHDRYKLLDPLGPDLYGNTDDFLNKDLTVTLAKNNFKRVARLMRENNEVFEQVKWTVIAAARCDTSLAIPFKTYDWLQKNSYFKDPKIADQALPIYSGVSHFEIGAAPMKIDLPTKREYPNASISDAITLLFEAFGINTEDWSMDFRSQGGRLAFQERFGTPTNPRDNFRDAMKEVWRDQTENIEGPCKDIQAKSMAQMKDISKLQQLRDKVVLSQQWLVKKPLISLCIGCHTLEDGITPQIPYDNPEQLAKALVQTGYPRGRLIDEIEYRTGQHASSQTQMPPRNYIGPNERKELLQYLNSLIND